MALVQQARADAAAYPFLPFALAPVRGIPAGAAVGAVLVLLIAWLVLRGLSQGT